MPNTARSHATKDIHPPSLLIVEDEPFLREAMARSFERCGYRVCAAASIADARQLLQACCFDCFVFDVGLPDGDGLSLLDEARAARTLVISGDAEPERLQASGVEHFLAKPFDLRELTGRIAELPSLAPEARDLDAECRATEGKSA